jgi:hypothetical protein
MLGWDPSDGIILWEEVQYVVAGDLVDPGGDLDGVVTQKVPCDPLSTDVRFPPEMENLYFFDCSWHSVLQIEVEATITMEQLLFSRRHEGTFQFVECAAWKEVSVGLHDILQISGMENNS